MAFLREGTKPDGGGAARAVLVLLCGELWVEAGGRVGHTMLVMVGAGTGADCWRTGGVLRLGSLSIDWSRLGWVEIEEVTLVVLPAEEGTFEVGWRLSDS